MVKDSNQATQWQPNQDKAKNKIETFTSNLCLKKSTHQIHSIEVTKVVAQSNLQGALKLYSKTRRIRVATRPKNENGNEHN
jgi:hypothetical protein